MRLIRFAALGALVLSGIVSSAAAQPFEQSGLRAQGMGGAFVAVADDASATWWNPAALAGGPFFNLLFEHQQQPEPGSRVDGVALATPPLGLSYQHLREFVPSEGSAADSRETESDDLYRMVSHVIGVTLLHSVTSGFVVGSTVKFVHGDIEEVGSTRVDLDLGVHYRVGPVRAGLVVRNLVEPSYDAPDGGEATPRRHARAGVAWDAGEATTIAADADLTDVEAAWPGRRVAFGAEQRFGRLAAVRGGVRLRTSEGPDPWVSLGGSYAVKAGLWVDGFWGRSPDQNSRWGIGARVTY